MKADRHLTRRFSKQQIGEAFVLSIDGMVTEDLLGTTQIAAMSTDDLNALTTAQFAAFGSAQVAALTSTQVDGRGLGWRLFSDGGFVGLGTVANGTSRVAVSGFSPPVGGALLLSATYNNGVVAQPVSSSLLPTSPPAQLSQSRAGHRFSQVAPWRGGAIAVWQRLTTLEAMHVVWRVLPDGGHAAAPDLEDMDPERTDEFLGLAWAMGFSIAIDLAAEAWDEMCDRIEGLAEDLDQIDELMMIGTEEENSPAITLARRMEILEIIPGLLGALEAHRLDGRKPN